MKKFFNILICAVFVFCGALVFAACGGKGGDKDADKPKFEVDTSNATTEFHWGDNFTTDGLVVRFGDTTFTETDEMVYNTYMVEVFTKEDSQAYLQSMKTPGAVPPIPLLNNYIFGEDSESEYVVVISCLPSMQVIQEMSKQGILAPYVLTYNITVSEPTLEIYPVMELYMAGYPLTFDIKVNGKTVSSLNTNRGTITLKVYFENGVETWLQFNSNGVSIGSRGVPLGLGHGKYTVVATYNYRYMEEREYTASCEFEIWDGRYDLQIHTSKDVYLEGEVIEYYLTFDDEVMTGEFLQIFTTDGRNGLAISKIVGEDAHEEAYDYEGWDFSEGLPEGDYVIRVYGFIYERSISAECRISVVKSLED